jgi:hypothetical protein
MSENVFPEPGTERTGGTFNPATEGEVSRKDFTSAQHRAWMQAILGRVAAMSIFGSLLGVVGTACYLAIRNRSPDYIDAFLRSFQPYLLPGIGAIIGFAVGRAVGGKADGGDG